MPDSPARSIYLQPITVLLAVSAVGVSFWWWNGGDVQVFMTDSRLWSEPWRLVSAVLPHVNLVHLLFNLYWLVVFGGTVESAYGSLKTALLFLFLGIGSSLADYAFSHSGVGLSGIGYGLFVFLWVLGRHDARFSHVVDAGIVQLFVFWFFLCIALTMLQMWQVANVAHGAGAIFGGLLGWCVVARSSKMRITSRVLFAVVLASVVLAAAVGRPYVNFSGIVADESGYLGYRALKDGDANQAVEYLETAVRLKPQDSGNWFNLGVAYYRLQRLDDAVAAYQRAIELSPDNADFKKALIQLKAYAADARRRSEGV